MSKFTTSKVVAAIVGMTMVLGVVASSSTALAQAMSLSDLVKLFISLGIISPDKAAAAMAAVSAPAMMSASFSKDLTVGSRGDDVMALQKALGVNQTGYFGSLTKAAVMVYQKANSISATGYVGPLTRASLNASSAMVKAPDAMAKAPAAMTGPAPVINSGIEGILTVDAGSISNVTLYEGQTMVPVIAAKLQARLSDINVQRVKLNLGVNTTIYTKVFKTMYVVDDSGKVLAQADLNSNTVVRSGSDYFLTLGGFSYNVPKDSTKVLTVRADIYSAIKTADLIARTITIGVDGVRSTDGAGVEQFGPSTAFSQTLSISGSLTDSAQLLVSTNSANFLSADVVASEGSNNNQLDKVSLLAFDVRAQKDSVEITDLNITVNGTGVATATAAYLFDGSNLLASASVNAGTGVAKFTNIDYIVAKDTTKVLTVKVDLQSAASTLSTFNVSVLPSGFTAENGIGSTVTPTGSATGNTFNVRNAGPVFTLVSTSISKTQSPLQNNFSTSTIDATFTLGIKAVGADVTFGTQSASSTFNFGIYVGGAINHGLAVGTSTASIAWSVPSTGVVSSGLAIGQAFKLSQNNSVNLPVSFIFNGRLETGVAVTTTSYAVGLEKITWSLGAGQTTSNFMAGQTNWRTSTSQLP